MIKEFQKYRDQFERGFYTGEFEKEDNCFVLKNKYYDGYFHPVNRVITIEYEQKMTEVLKNSIPCLKFATKETIIKNDQVFKISYNAFISQYNKLYLLSVTPFNEGDVNQKVDSKINKLAYFAEQNCERKGKISQIIKEYHQFLIDNVYAKPEYRLLFSTGHIKK
jgi:hypothetical protein